MALTIGGSPFLANANCTPPLEEKDLKNASPKNYLFWTLQHT